MPEPKTGSEYTKPTKPAERKRYALLDWAYYHGPNAVRLGTIASLAVGNLAVIAAVAKYVVS